MKKSSLILLALCAGAPLMAQAPNLSFYGVLDTGVARVAHTLDFNDYFPVTTNPFPNKASKSAIGMFNGGLSQNRVGIKGSTDLVDGWKAVFTVETAFNITSGQVSDAAKSVALNGAAANSAAVPDPNTGRMVSADSSISGQLFNRGAYVGVSHATYGTLTLGRQQSLMLDILPGYDALGLAQLFTPIGFTGQYGGGGVTDSSRVDSAIKYKVKIGDVTIAALHKVSGVADSTSAKGSDQVSLAYESGPFGIVAAYQKFTDVFAIGQGAAIGQVALTAQDTKATLLAARYKIGPVLITAGYQGLDYANPSDPVNCAAVQNYYGQIVSSVNVTPYTIAGVEADKKLTLYYAGAAWDVTSQFTVAASYYQLKQNDYSQGTYNPATVNNTKGAGKSKYASLLLTYKITKAFDLYGAYMNAKNTDALTSGLITPNDVTTNSVLGVGIRYKF